MPGPKDRTVHPTGSAVSFAPGKLLPAPFQPSRCPQVGNITGRFYYRPHYSRRRYEEILGVRLFSREIKVMWGLEV